MLRFLYVSLIRLHPAQFRMRHGDEMLSAFDHARSDGSTSRMRLFGDGLASLIRQWALRPAEPAAIAQPAEGAPMFRAIEGGMPGRAALAYGCVLALASFSVLALAALRGAGRLPSWRLLEAVRGQVYAPQSWPAASFTRHAPARTGVFKQLDRDADGVLSAAEIDAATETLMGLLAVGPEAAKSTDTAPPAAIAGGTSAAEGVRMTRTRPRSNVRGRSVVYLDPLLSAFDLNQDGWLSQHELDYAPVVLSSLDSNRDGTLTLDEIE